MSIQEHFDIHYGQGDFKACQLIAGRMKNPSLGKKMSDEFKKQQSEIQLRRVKDGTHHLLGGEIQRKSNTKRVLNGTHNFQTDEAKKSIQQRNMNNIKNGVHCLLKRDDSSSVGGDSSRKRIQHGTHHFQNFEKQKELSLRATLVNQKSVLKMSLDREILKEYESAQHILLENPDYKSTIEK